MKTYNLILKIFIFTLIAISGLQCINSLFISPEEKGARFILLYFSSILLVSIIFLIWLNFLKKKENFSSFIEFLVLFGIFIFLIFKTYF